MDQLEIGKTAFDTDEALRSIDFHRCSWVCYCSYCFPLLFIAFHCFQVTVFSIPRGTAKTYIDNCMGAGGTKTPPQPPPLRF